MFFCLLLCERALEFSGSHQSKMRACSFLYLSCTSKPVKTGFGVGWYCHVAVSPTRAHLLCFYLFVLVPLLRYFAWRFRILAVYIVNLNFFQPIVQLSLCTLVHEPRTGDPLMSFDRDSFLRPRKVSAIFAGTFQISMW